MKLWGCCCCWTGSFRASLADEALATDGETGEESIYCGLGEIHDTEGVVLRLSETAGGISTLGATIDAETGRKAGER